MASTTPKKIDWSVRKFCKSLNPNAEPTYVKVEPDPGADFAECFFNVLRRVEKYGGELVYGWRIWVWPKVFVEAEHHGIWRADDGGLLDVSPLPEGEGRILFLEDMDLVFDYENRRRRDNIRKPLVADTLVSRYLNAAQELSEFLNNHFSNGEYVGMSVDELERLQVKSWEISYEVTRKYLKGNDLCTCGSGRKVKKCCGMQKAVENRHPDNLRRAWR